MRRIVTGVHEVQGATRRTLPHIRYDHEWSNKDMQTVMVSELKAKLRHYLAEQQPGVDGRLTVREQVPQRFAITPGECGARRPRRSG